MKRRGLSEVITTLIFILLAIIAIGIVWYVFNNIINQNQSQINLGKITDNVQINDAKVGILQSKIKITNNGRDKMTGVKIFLSDGTNTNETNYNLNLGQYESTTITIPLTSGFQPTSATVTPVYGNIEGQTAIKDLTQNYSIEKNNGLVAYYKFENDAKDSSGNNLDGALTGTSDWTAGQIGSALNLKTSFVTTPVTSALDTDTHTIAFWIQLTLNSDGTWRRIFAYTPSPTDRSPTIWVNLNLAALHWRYANNTAVNTGYCNQCGENGDMSTFQIGQWYFITGTKNGRNFTYYVNGVLKGSSIIANPKYPGSSQIYLGQTAPWALIDELAIFNRSLTTKEIQQIYNSQK